MINHKLTPLTESEKAFATANHDIIKSFLRRFRYDIEEYYSIAVPGYLKAVQIYLRREDLRNQYTFQCISYQCMRSQIGNYIKAMNTQKRKTSKPIISLDAEYSDDTESLYNCIGGKSLESEYIEMETITQLLQRFSDTPRNIIILKMEGYDNTEICERLEICSTTFYKELRKIKESLIERLGE